MVDAGALSGSGRIMVRQRRDYIMRKSAPPIE